MMLDLAVMVFHHIDDADHAYADACEAGSDAAWLREAAIVEHHRHDRIAGRGSVAGHYVDADDQQDVTGKKAVEEALTGALGGAVFEPAGIGAGCEPPSPAPPAWLRDSPRAARSAASRSRTAAHTCTVRCSTRSAPTSRRSR